MKNKKIIILIILLSIFSYLYIQKRNVVDSQVEIQSISQDIYDKYLEKTTGSQLQKNTLMEKENILRLREEFSNTDIIGFLTIPETSISYPVAQTVDNFYYLDYDLYKNPSIAGSIYLDYENNIEQIDYNTVIYGHNMRDDIMFHSLRYYSSKDFYENHKYIYYSTLYDDYIYEIFSVYETSVDFPYITVIFEDNDSFYELSSQFKARSMYDTNVPLTPNDKVITLSTCTSSSLDSNRRFVVQGKLISVNGKDV